MAKLSERDLAQFIRMIPALAGAVDAHGRPALFNQYDLACVGLSQEQMMGDDRP